MKVSRRGECCCFLCFIVTTSGGGGGGGLRPCGLAVDYSWLGTLGFLLVINDNGDDDDFWWKLLSFPSRSFRAPPFPFWMTPQHFLPEWSLRWTHKHEADCLQTAMNSMRWYRR
ncbi:hypothetical protein K435DRAFT_778305 [Dendrothele bispora CBS 962.96]|uniref:Secreted protein n=1 Tax=Dendrothele bispora (strain CBS 962.96) TaxID=1314807 RepID=A0A4V4HG02_DENBC|nr:hypothetical protein K435DRAFT_778305 [Dendrothele bispora CBS 962.96]